MPKAGTRLLPRFEVVQVAPRRYCAFDYQTHLARWAADPRSHTATQMIVEMLEREAQQKGQETTLYRAETPAVKKPSDPKPKATTR